MEEMLRVRVHRLERRLQALWLGIVLAVLALFVLSLGIKYAESQSEVLRAREVNIVDSKGRTAITLTTRLPGDTPGIVLYDDAGKRRITMTLLPGFGLTMALADPEGNDRITLSVLPSGPSLRLQDARGNAVFKAP